VHGLHVCTRIVPGPSCGGAPKGVCLGAPIHEVVIHTRGIAGKEVPHDGHDTVAGIACTYQESRLRRRLSGMLSEMLGVV
jgi:hypothetical protein